MSMIAHSSSSRFSIGVPVIASVRRAGEPAQRAGALRRRVLDVLRLVEQEPVPGDRRERVDVAGGDVVRGDRRRRCARGDAASSAPLSRSPPWWRCTRSDGANRSISRAHCATTLIGQTTSVGPKRLGAELLALRGRASRSPARSCRGPCRRRGSRRSRGRRAAAASRGRAPGTGRAAASSPPGCRERSKRRSSPPVEQRAERVVERDLAELEPRILQSRRPRPRGRGRRPTPSRRRSRKRSAFSTSERRSACQRPRMRIERLLGGRELGELLLGQRRVADRELPVEPREGVGREEAARACAVALVAVRLTRSLPAELTQFARQQHGHADLLELRDRRAEDEANVVVARARASVGSTGSKARPPSASTGSISPSWRCTRERGSAERRKPKTSSPPSCRAARWGGRASDRRPPAATARARRWTAAVARARAVALVEPEAEQPRRAASGVSRPRSTQSVSRRSSAPSPACGGSSGSADGEPVEEELGRARAAAHRAGCRAGRPPREGGRARSGRRRRRRGRARARRGRRRTRRRTTAGSAAAIASSASCTRLVDRRAPEGEPRARRRAASCGWSEALGDRALRRARARRTSRAREPPSSRPAGGSAARRDQLREADPACARAVPELRQVGDRGDPDLQPAGRERAVAAACEHGRADILLPQDLERGPLGGGVVRDRLGCGHEPFRIRVSGGRRGGAGGCRGGRPAGRPPRAARCSCALERQGQGLQQRCVRGRDRLAGLGVELVAVRLQHPVAGFRLPRRRGGLCVRELRRTAPSRCSPS